jgi:hypothetical protein
MLTFEQAKYDHYVTSGGGDVCFAYGMSGHCGPECPEFGHRDGCAGLNDNMEDGDTNG